MREYLRSGKRIIELVLFLVIGWMLVKELLFPQNGGAPTMETASQLYKLINQMDGPRFSALSSCAIPSIPVRYNGTRS